MPDLKALIEDEATLAHPCFVAISELLGPEWVEWEPEVVWLTAHRAHKVTVPVGNRGQILAFRSLLTTGRFWYDALVFSKTASTFNNEDPGYDSFDFSVPVAYMNWAVYEATRAVPDFQFGDEVARFIAARLYEGGYRMAPMYLAFAQDYLDDYYPRGSESDLAELKKLWASESDLKETDPDDPNHVQLEMLRAVRGYYRQRKRDYMRQMADVGV